MNEYLIAKLKEGRIKKGLKQSDVTQFTGIKNTTLSNYENGITEPDIDTFLQLCELYELDYAGILAEAYGLSVQGEDFKIRPSEIEVAKKYRFISANSPDGAKMVDTVLDREHFIAKLLSENKELEGRTTNIIEFDSYENPSNRFVEYHRSASAGDGVFILGNEAPAKIAIPESDWNELADYAISISGTSMEPDYKDGDTVLVSQRVQMRYGDVGIFVVDGKAYIKEYGEKELISRNPDAENIKISEFANIVCMGKVVGKIHGEFRIIND